MVLGPNNRKLFFLASPGTDTTLGSDDIDYLTLYHENTDLTAGIYAATPRKSTVATPTEFRDNRLQFLNPAQTKKIRVRTLDFLNDFDLTIPLIDDNDEFLLTHHTQPMYNKTIDIASNTITSASQMQGDLMRNDGAKFVRFPIGLPGQVLTVKSTGLDFEWANPSTIVSPAPSPPSPPGPPPPPGGPFIPDDNTVTSQKIVDGAIATVDIADSAITTLKIADLNVTTGKIANLGVTGAKIADLTITSGKIADGAVTATKIADANVTNSKLVDNSITATKIVDGTITGTKIGTATVTNSNLFGQISNDKLLPITDTTKLPTGIRYDWTAIKYGAYTLSSWDGGDGVFNGFLTRTPTGSHEPIFATTSGLRARFHTGTTAGNRGGWRTTRELTRRNNNPRLDFRLGYDTTNLVIFIGYTSLLGAFPAGNTILESTEEGFGLFIDTGRTNVGIARNDNVGAQVTTDVSPVTSIASGGTHTVSITCDDVAGTWTLTWDGTPNTFPTDIPQSGTNLALVCQIEALTGSDRLLDIRYLQWLGNAA